MPATDDQHHSQSITQRRRRSVARRWIPRLVVALITLVIVVFVAVQIVFTTTIPKQIVIAQVQKALGLRVTAASLSTGWLGRTTLRDVQVALPLSEKAFCTLPTLRVRHTNLPLLALTQSITIYSIELDKPAITVTQDRFGRWNLQDVAELLLKLGGQGQAQQTPNKSSPFILPNIMLRDGDVEITDNKNRHASLTPLNLTGTAESSLVWKYDASMNAADGANAAFTGRVVPSENFAHEVSFQLSHLAALAQPWIANFDPNAAISGNWKGALSDGGVSGRLLLDQLHYSTLAAERGDFTVRAANGAVAVGPSALLARAGNSPLLSVKVTGGSIRADTTSAKIDQLNLTALGGQVRLDGAVAFTDFSGKLSVNWNQLHPSSAVDSTGSFTAAVQPQWPARHTVTAQFVASGTALGSPYSSDVHINAAGTTWDAATVAVDAPTLRYDWKTPVRLDGLVANLVSNPGKIALTDVSISSLGRSAGAVSGSGALTFDPKNPSNPHYDWWAYFAGQNLTVPPIPNSRVQPPPVAGSFDAWGNQQDACLHNAYAVIGSIFATADGVYHFSNPKPVDANVFIAEVRTPTTSPTTAPAFLQGHLRGDAHLTGTVAPLDLVVAGQLHGRGLIIGDRPLDNIDVKCTGSADPSHVVIDTDELHLLGGQWKLHAQVPGNHERAEATVQFHDLKLANVAELAHQSDTAGTAAGMIDAELSEPSIEGLHAAGTFSASAVQARQLKIDSATGGFSVQQGQVSLTPIHLTHGNGHADASLNTNVAHPTIVTATVDAADWPVDAMAAHALLALKTDGLIINAATQTVAGRLTFGADVDYQQQHAATAKGAVTLSGQTVNLDSFNAEALGGTATGTASFTLATPLDSRAEFHWTGLNLNSLSPYEERLREAGGSFAGQAILAPVGDARALAPLLLTIDATGTKTHLGPVQLAGWHLPIWLNRDPGYRMVLDDGRIDVADGSISLFGRVSQHVDNILTAQLNATLHDLDIDQLINEVEMSSSATTQLSATQSMTPPTAGKPTTTNQKAAYPGRLSGQIDANGDPRNIKSCFANIALNIHDSDLANFGPFAALYNIMHLGGGPGTPIGKGTVNARYDNDDFIITSLYYFNRGVYAYGDPRVDDIRKYPMCPQSGSVAGTFRPLENIKLPFFADADQILSVLQSNFSAISLGGTVHAPTYTPQSVADLGSALKKVLIGDTQAKQQ